MKTTKSKKTQYSGEITMIEFLAANPDLTTAEIASALGRGMPSGPVISFASYTDGSDYPGGMRNGAALWRVNDMPFGCANRLRAMFENLLRECRGVAQ
jgi:hypothetical protein